MTIPKRLALTGMLVVVAVITIFSFQRRLEEPETQARFGLTIGPKTLVPMPAFVPLLVSPQEFESVLATLVRHEKWFGTLTDASIRYSVNRTNHPPMIEQMRKNLANQFPGMRVTVEEFSYLAPTELASRTIAFDRTRFAFSNNSSVNDYCSAMVWDGSVATGVHGPVDKPINYFLLGTRKDCSSRAFQSFPIIGHTGSSYYDDIFASIEDEQPEISAGVDFDGQECLVVQTWNDSWIVRRTDHRVLARVGYRNVSLFTDHTEVSQDISWPTSMIYRSYTSGRELEMTVVTTVEKLETDSAPSESEFEQELIAGVKVSDLRHATPVNYRHDPDRTEEEWDAINAKITANETRDRAREQRKRAILGKTAAEFGPGRWLNSKPISIDQIRERGAEIGFMGVGCGPCENLLSYFAQNETADRPLRLLVFNQGDSDEGIRKKLLPYKVDCPVFVPDASEKHVWGDVYGRYAVEGLPTTVLIEPGGAIIKHRTGVLWEE